VTIARTTADSIADRFEIEDLMTRYLDTLDGADVEGFVACFASDGEIRTNEGDEQEVYRGPAQIRGFVEARGGYAFHASMDSTVRIDGDRGERTSRWIAFPSKVRDDGVPAVLWIGRGRDELVRTSDGWRIAVREISVFQGASPDL
jgi:hypothetical protein